jgi:hypothetical protein
MTSDLVTPSKTVWEHERWPDFLVIGAAKAGTTALYKAICRHPRVYKPMVKEPGYLNFPDIQPRFKGPGGERANRHTISTRNQYLDLYKHCPSEQLTGDFSIGYLDNWQAPASAKKWLPNAQVIALLRHPVERAYSQYLHLRQESAESNTSFEQAWGESDWRQAENWRPAYWYQHRGFYARHLYNWLRFFPRNQLLILFYEDWLQNPQGVLSQIWHHLGVQDIADLKITRENVSSRQPRWTWLNHHENPVRHLAQRTLPLWARDAITTAVGTVNLQPGPTLDPSLRARLANTYHDDISQLEALTGRDLTAWHS